MLIIMAVATGLLASCNQSYPYLEYDLGGDTGQGENAITQTPVQLYISEQTFFSTSRSGTGPLDPYDGLEKYYNKYRKMEFRTFAFRVGSATDFTASYTTDTNRDNCLVSDKDGSHLGMLTRPVNKFPGDDTSTNMLYFYETSSASTPVTLYYNTSTNQKTGYNFFTFTTDGATVEKANAQSDRITYTLRIDGTQDIMAGAAPLMTRRLLDSLYVGANFKSLTSANRDTIAANGGYSAYAAHRNVDPRVSLKHLLTRLRFNAYVGNEDADGITIDSVTVNTYPHVMMTVAARNVENISIAGTGTKSYIPIFEDSEDGIKACKTMISKKMTYNASEAGLKIVDRTPITLGGATMVLPDTEIQIIVHGKRKTTDGTTGEGTEDSSTATSQLFHTPFTLRSSEGFKAGNTYTIGILIYGNDKIYATYDLTGWHNGGDVELED